MKQDQQTLITLISILQSIGYNDEVPYLARLANGKNTAPAIRAAATAALAHMGAGDPKSLDPAALFYELAEKFYYGNSSISLDMKNNAAFIWFWDETNGLYKEDVPPGIFNDLMAMRAAEYSLKENAAKPPAGTLGVAAVSKASVGPGL